MKGRDEAENKLQERLERCLLVDSPAFVVSWYQSLVAQGLTMKTCYRYVEIVHRFLAHEQFDQTATMADITPDVLTQYFAYIKYRVRNGQKEKMSDNYRHTVWFALNSLFEYHLKIGTIQTNYMTVVKPAKKKKQHTKRYYLTADDFKIMLDHVPGSNATIRIRNRTILLILMTTGMRVSALCQMNVEDVDMNEKKITIIDKGEKEHNYKITPQLEHWLNYWIQIRGKLFVQTDALFVNSQMTRLTDKSVREMVIDNAQIALGKHLTPHKLRAGLCSILYEQTHDIEMVRRSIGHSDISTTQRYIVTNDDDKQQAAEIIASLL